MPITTQCQLLGLSRSSLYYRTREVSACDLTLMRRLDELHLEHPFLGSRKLTRLLTDEGHAIGRRHVVTLMRAMGMEAIYRKRRTSVPDHAHKIYPYLLSQVVIERPNQAWAADITYLPMAKGFVYLVAILDLYSRKVVAWRSVKYEEVYLHAYATPREINLALSRYFSFYNGRRPHQSLDQNTPDAVYFAVSGLSQAA